jgi:hypothetical protein
MVKCPHCDGTSWRTEIIEPRLSNYKLTAIVCESCNAPAGFLDFFNIGDMLMEINKRLGIR